MVYCHLVSAEGIIDTIEITLGRSLTLEALIRLPQLENLSAEHKAYRAQTLLLPESIIEPEDSISFLLSCKLDAAAWRQQRLKNKTVTDNSRH